MLEEQGFLPCPVIDKEAMLDAGVFKLLVQDLFDAVIAFHLGKLVKV